MSSYIGKEPCHKNAKTGELYHIAVCVVCGEEYEKRDIEEEIFHLSMEEYFDFVNYRIVHEIMVLQFELIKETVK